MELDSKFVILLMSIVTSTGTFAFFLGRLDQTVKELKEQSTKDNNAAHSKIRELKEELNQRLRDLHDLVKAK